MNQLERLNYMREFTDKVDFPIFNISYRDWNSADFQDFMVVSHEIYDSSDNAFFERYFVNQEYVDGSGNTWRIVRKKDVYIKKMVFFTRRVGIIQLERGEAKMSYDDFVELFKRRVNQVKVDSVRKIHMDTLKGENSIGAVIKKFSLF